MIDLVYLGWDKPFLHSLADWLLENSVTRVGQAADLRDFCVLLPGRRYGRKLLQRLARRSDSPILPPQVVTPSGLARILTPPTATIAGPLASRLAWVNAAQSAEPWVVESLGYRVAKLEDLWSVSGQLSELHVSLAAGGYTMEGWRTGFPRSAQDIVYSHDGESERWDALALVQRKYVEQLAGVDLVDEQLARIQPNPLKSDTLPSRLVLAGMSTLSSQLRLMINNAIEAGVQCSALVFAEAAYQEEMGVDRRFDRFGCIRQDWWKSSVLPIAEDQIQVFKDPASQVGGVLGTLACLPAGSDTSDLVIGVCDPSVDSLLVEQISILKAESGEPLRVSSGKQKVLASCSAFDLLRRAANFGRSRSAQDFAELIEHPALSMLPAGSVAAFDRYRRHHQPEFINGFWRFDPNRVAYSRRLDAEDRETLTRAFASVVQVFSALWENAERSLSELLTLILKTLEEVYGTGPVAESVGLPELFEALDSLLVEADLCALPSLSVSGPSLMKIALDLLASTPIAPDGDVGAIELLEWLELPLDDAQHLVITGLNDGLVPAGIQVSPFLPNALRKALHLEDDALRLAREKFALEGMIRSRMASGTVAFICGRTSIEGDPLLPSRLLLSVADEALPGRVKRLCSDPLDTVPTFATPSGGRTHVLPTVVPLPTERIKDVLAKRRYSVTDFAAYIRCPYAFAAERLLSLTMPEANEDELDASEFGSWIHAILEAFGRDEEARALSDEEEIRGWLAAALERMSGRRFGSEATIETQVQMAQILGRLMSFAQFQAKRRAEGWSIEHTELRLEGVLAVSSERTVSLRGRIDRVDRHVSGKVAILDYKTSDEKKEAAKSHRGEDGWRDLQLPLCRHLWENSAFYRGEAVQVGYISLPREQDRCGLSLLELGAEEFSEAVLFAGELTERIEALQFEPSEEKLRRRMDVLRGFGFLDVDTDQVEEAS